MNNKTKKKLIIGSLAAALLFSGGTLAALAAHQKKHGQADSTPVALKFDAKKVVKEDEKYSIKDFDFEIDPETFQITLRSKGHEFTFSGNQGAAVANVKKSKDAISWAYPDKGIQVKVEKQDDHLQVEMTPQSDEVEEIDFPKIQGDTYYLPIGEGKSIPADNASWQSYFQENDALDLNESFSMSFLSAVQDNTAATVVMEDNFNKELEEDTTTPTLDFQLKTSLNRFNRKDAQKYDIYLSDNDPVAVAKLYQKNRIENKQFTSLADKAKTTPEVNKLIGAPHIYFWQSRILTTDDVKWQKLQKEDHQKLYQHVGDLLERYSEDGRTEFDNAIAALNNGEAYKYEKNTVLTGLNTVLAYPDFYDTEVLPALNQKDQEYLEKTKDDMPTEKRFAINKQLLKGELKDSTVALDQWGQSTSSEVMNDMKASGINHAWIGLANWNQGLINPQFVQTAKKDGYLIGPYDSYQSIHETPSIDWNTAGFKNNEDVYNNKTIMKPSGEYVSGFLGKGRKVNQTLIDDEWQYRMKSTTSKEVPFNTWFLDTDAAGEIYNDFSPEHLTSMTEDVQARLKRAAGMAEKGLVIGTETGNDYFNQGMVFAHGLETPVIAWSDPDMRENKESPYYVGGYAALGDDIPERYSKQVPIKDEYKATTIDPVYSLPLYKLVYNESVITTHHWEWDSYKIQDEVQNRRLKEYLYNVPPLVHLDAATWNERKQDLVTNGKNWETFQKAAINQEMTDFNYLTEDKLVQETNYGKDLSVIANFSDQAQTVNGETLQPHTALITNHGKQTVIENQ
ncbi:glycoside hydrolase [Enterococcus sp. AZ109]|uniref:glycoside hydrolase n=1 Tax=Enterococcus sp. AZ109 TaxID=2774634 RepID=UPI003F216407